MRRRRRPYYRPDSDRWLISYADYVTLLLALFVVLYAMSSVDKERMQSAISGMRTAFAQTDSSSVSIETVIQIPRANPSDETDTSEDDDSDISYVILRDRLETTLEEQTGTDSDAAGMRTHRSDRGLVISLAAKDFFHPGDTEILREALGPLNAIGSVLALSTQLIRIEGHTDDTPINTERFPSNWELSTARASAVARHLIKHLQIAPRRIGASGYAEFQPIAPNDSPENRALNRRIDIVVLKTAQEQVEQPEIDELEARSPLQTLLEQLPPLSE